MAALDKLEHPKPLRDFTYDLSTPTGCSHPWVADHNIRPKSVARDLFERAMGFDDYVALLRHRPLGGPAAALPVRRLQGPGPDVPEDAKTDELLDLTEWLGELVRQVDSSLLDEWERLRHPAERWSTGRPGAADAVDAAHRRHRQPPGLPRHGAQRRCSAGSSWPPAATGPRSASSTARPAGTPPRWRGRLAPYFERAPDRSASGPTARGPALFQARARGAHRALAGAPGARRPRRLPRVGLVLEVDLAASDDVGAAVVRPLAVEQL